jgi:hypothetical protein
MAATPAALLLMFAPPLPLPPLLLWLCRCSKLMLPSPSPAAARDADSADVGVLQCRLLPTDDGLAAEQSPVPPELARLWPTPLSTPPLLLGLLVLPCEESSLYSRESSVMVRMCLGIRGGHGASCSAATVPCYKTTHGGGKQEAVEAR